MPYKIRFTPAANRQFRKLPRQIQTRLKGRIEALVESPRPRGVEKLQGEEDLYRIRSGDYRVIYQLTEKDLLIVVVKIGHRREIYR